MFRLCLLAAGAAAISTDAIVDDVDGTLRSALSHLRENLKVDVRPAELALLKEAPNLVRLLATARDGRQRRRGELLRQCMGVIARRGEEFYKVRGCFEPRRVRRANVYFKILAQVAQGQAQRRVDVVDERFRGDGRCSAREEAEAEHRFAYFLDAAGNAAAKMEARKEHFQRAGETPKRLRCRNTTDEGALHWKQPLRLAEALV